LFNPVNFGYISDVAARQNEISEPGKRRSGLCCDSCADRFDLQLRAALSPKAVTCAWFECELVLDVQVKNSLPMLIELNL